jgi:hypothetical protein
MVNEPYPNRVNVALPRGPAQRKPRWNMIPKKPAPDVIRGGSRFSDKIMLKRKN